MASAFGKIRTTFASLADTVRNTLAEASEESLWDLCQAYEVSSNTAFAEADLDLLEWELVQEDVLINAEDAIDRVDLLRAELDGSSGHLAGTER